MGQTRCSLDFGALQACLNKVPKDCQALSNLEELNAIRRRIGAEEASYGYVKIGAKKGVMLAWKDVPFDPSLNRAGRAAFESVKKSRKFIGLLPVGDYKVSDGSTITVKKTNWKKSKDCVKKIQKKKRSKFLVASRKQRLRSSRSRVRNPRKRSSDSLGRRRKIN